jgi:hypothetical protein
VKVYWLMTQSLSTPQKWKDRSIEDLDFRLCILGLRTIKRGCSMKSWGEIKSYTLLHPFAIWLRELCRNPAFGDFMGGDSEHQSRRLWLWARDSGQRIRPPKLIFHPSGASLCCPSGDSEVFVPKSQRLRSLQAGDSGWHRRLRTPKSRDSGVSRPNG